MSAEAPATNGEEQGKKKPDRKKDETPIEELYDLSKPIPRVERPNKDEYEKELKAIDDEFDALKAQRAKVQEKIDAAMADPEEKASLQETRVKLAQLKQRKMALIDEKKAMRGQLDQAKNQTEKLMRDKKDVRSNVKFNSVEEIDKEIAKLQRKQETTTMTLNEEKKLIKEMDALNASKKYVSELKAKDTAMDDVKEQRKSIHERIKSKDKEIDEVSKQIDEIMATLKKVNEKETKKRDAIKGLFDERDGFKKQMAEKLKEKDAVRDAFRQKNNEWYNNQRAVRAQKKMQYEEEKKKREEERAAYLAKLEEEEAKKIPYEEEQALCDYLADYLERTYLTAGKSENKEEKKLDVVAVKDDPFAGMKAVGKKDEEQEYFGKGKGKKKRVRQAKKQDSVTQAPFTLSVDSFEQFGLLQLTPPTSVDQVEASVVELRAKKEWYKQQPRNSVPTAKEIRKENEKAAAKLRQSTSGSAAEAKPAKKQGNFSLSNDDFAPLGSGGTASVNSSWGQKPAGAAPATEEQPEM